MNVKAIELEGGKPAKVTVEMGIREAMIIAYIQGKHSPNSLNEIIPGFSEESSEVYIGLTGELFNRFWDDGLEGAIRGDEE